MYRFSPTNSVSTVQIRSGAVEGRKRISRKPESRWASGPCVLSTRKILKLGEQDLGNGNCRFAWVNYVFRKMVVVTGACVLLNFLLVSEKGCSSPLGNRVLYSVLCLVSLPLRIFFLFTLPSSILDFIFSFISIPKILINF